MRGGRRRAGLAEQAKFGTWKAALTWSASTTLSQAQWRAVRSNGKVAEVKVGCLYVNEGRLQACDGLLTWIILLEEACKHLVNAASGRLGRLLGRRPEQVLQVCPRFAAPGAVCESWVHCC